MTQNRAITPLALLVACALAVGAGACGGKKDTIPTGIAEADKFLFERGTELLNDEKWLTAREFFGRLVDNYPQSPFRPDAKLGLGDTYLGEGNVESLVLAVNEFKEFLSFYPTHRRADYAQYKLALCHYRQMRGPERDQRETREAVQEFETFIAKYPNSPLRPEVQAEWRREMEERSAKTQWVTGGNNWYVNGEGINTNNWPGPWLEFRRRTLKLNPGDYRAARLEPAAATSVPIQTP